MLVLLLLPRVLQRFRIPAPLTAFTLGLAAGIAVPGLGADATLALLATLGISSLFLFAGLEIELEAFHRARWQLLAHLVLRALSLAFVAWAAMRFAGVPLLFMFFDRHVLPHAPGSEFSLLVMVGLIAAYLTKQLGVYYLVGAFLAGFTARLRRERMPRLASDDNLRAVRLFASFFVPFYFFASGSRIPPDAHQWQALALGIALSVVVLPLRIGIQWAHRRLVHRESAGSSLRVAVTLAPTLIFTLVLAGILRERYALPASWYGALLVYAFASTVLPSLLKARAFHLDPAQAR